MKLKRYSRKEYLEYCNRNGVKPRLDESQRNKLTESGYPIITVGGVVADEVSSDEWYYLHW